MLDDFFVRALVAGMGVAAVAGPLGCFVVWRRMSYFGDTVAHAGLLGVAIGLALQVDVIASVFAVALATALALMVLQRARTLPTDALLGLLSHSTLAMGLVLVSFMAWLRIDLMGYLFGDILAVSKAEIAIIYAGGAMVLASLAAIWRPLLADTVSAEMAQAEGLAPARARLVFMVLIAAVAAIAMKIVGIILVTSLLIIPAATARTFAATPERMAALATLIACASVAGGLYGSLAFDTPSGPSIVVAGFALFLASLIVRSVVSLKTNTLREAPHA